MSSDASDPSNWVPGAVPGATTDVELRTGENDVVNLDGDAEWNTIFFNSAGPTTIDGTGTLTLNSSGNTNAIFSAGGPLTSTINPDIVTTSNIQVNGQHSVTFNGDVRANKLESFGGTTSTYNGDVTVDDGILTIGGDSSVVFNGNFHWVSDGLLQTEYGINGQGGTDVTFTSFSSDFAVGLNIVNMYDDVRVHVGADYVFGGATGVWARRGENYVDLDGHDEAFDFMGSDMQGGGNSPDPNAPVVMGVDFGDSYGANSLLWATSNFMFGTAYPISNFEIGVDTLEMGAAGAEFFPDDLLAKVTINGIPYAAADPGDGTPYWTRDSLTSPFEPEFVNLPDLPGDYNADGLVDAADYTVWRDNLGAATTLPNDLSPGEVTDDDYGVWKMYYGSTSLGGSLSVPEPASTGLAVLALASAAACVRSKRRVHLS